VALRIWKGERWHDEYPKQVPDWLDRVWRQDNKRDRDHHVKLFKLIYPRATTKQARGNYRRLMRNQRKSKDRESVGRARGSTHREAVTNLVHAREALAVIMRHLSEVDRRIVVLMGLYGLTATEAAKREQTTRFTAQKAMAKARKVALQKISRMFRLE